RSGEATRVAESTGPVKVAGMIEPARMAVPARRVMTPKRRTVRNIGTVVVDNTAAMPISPPVMPTPSKAAKYADPEAKSKVDPRTGNEQPRNRHPAWIERKRVAVDEPGIVRRDIDDVRGCG